MRGYTGAVCSDSHNTHIYMRERGKGSPNFQSTRQRLPELHGSGAKRTLCQYPMDTGVSSALPQPNSLVSISKHMLKYILKNSTNFLSFSKSSNVFEYNPD